MYDQEHVTSDQMYSPYSDEEASYKAQVKRVRDSAYITWKYLVNLK